MDVNAYPAQLPLAGKKVLVVGAGPDAIARIVTLRAADAEVSVIAPRALAAIEDLADRGVISWAAREVTAADLDGCWLVVAASGDPGTDARVAALADGRRLFCLRGGGLVEATEPDSGKPAQQGGRVILVGGGPGDPGLLTVAGMQALRDADVVISDRLAPLAALTEVRPGAELIDVSKVPHGRNTAQDEINRLIVAHALAGKVVVRFKGGDNFVFGRGGEELEACRAAGIDVLVVPGVTSAIAAPALAGIPVTHRGLNQGFTVISGHVPPGDPRSSLDYAALAHTGTDLVLMMAVATLPAITAELIRCGMPTQTPAACVADAGLPTQRDVRGTVATIASIVAGAGIRSPAVTVIGAAAGFGR